MDLHDFLHFYHGRWQLDVIYVGLEVTVPMCVIPSSPVLNAKLSSSRFWVQQRRYVSDYRKRISESQGNPVICTYVVQRHVGISFSEYLRGVPSLLTLTHAAQQDRCIEYEYVRIKPNYIHIGTTRFTQITY